MTDIFIIRHAWAEEQDLLHWSTDWERPLTRDGRKRFAAMVERLVQRGFQPGTIATSPLVRCRQTAEIVTEVIGNDALIVELDALQPGSDLDALLGWTAHEAGEHQQVAWVGHAPDVGWLASRLIAAETGYLRFSKGAIAAIRFAGHPRAGEGTLRWFVTAKVLGC